MSGKLPDFNFGIRVLVLKKTGSVHITYVHASIFTVAKQYVLHILSVFVAVVILHAVRMHHIIFSSVACPVFFPHYLISGTILEKSY
jgi:hypothetical protein